MGEAFRSMTGKQMQLLAICTFGGIIITAAVIYIRNWWRERHERRADINYYNAFRGFELADIAESAEDSAFIIAESERVVMESALDAVREALECDGEEMRAKVRSVAKNLDRILD